MLKLRWKTKNIPLKNENNCNLVKHACQNMVAMETSKLMDKGTDVKMVPDKF